MENTFRKMVIVSVILIFVTTGIGCSKDTEGNSEKIGDNNETVVENVTTIKNSTRMEAAHTFVQAMVDKDYETVDQLSNAFHRDHKRTSKGSFYEGHAIEDYEFTNKEAFDAVHVILIDGKVGSGHVLEFTEEEEGYFLSDYRY